MQDPSRRQASTSKAWATLLLVCTLVAAPVDAKRFEDTRKRFSFQLAKGWKFAPQPGDTNGATFKKQQGQLFAILSIRVLPADHQDTETFARRWFAAATDEPGYRTIKDGAGQLSGVPARVRQFVMDIDGDTEWVKMTSETIAVVGDHAYVLHGESVAQAFSTFADDLRRMSSSFTIPRRVAIDPKVVGRWSMQVDAATVLTLNADGGFDLAGTTGRFRADGNTLVTTPSGGKSERFDYRVQGDRLSLRLQNTDSVFVYQRIASRPTLLFGRWQAGERRLRLSPGGVAIYGKRTGRYRVDDGMLLFRFKGQSRQAVQYDLGADRTGQPILTLRGGNFGPKTVFSRP